MTIIQNQKFLKVNNLQKCITNTTCINIYEQLFISPARLLRRPELIDRSPYDRIYCMILKIANHICAYVKARCLGARRKKKGRKNTGRGDKSGALF